MIDETGLRDDLIHLLTATENNIRRRCDEEPAVNRPLEERYDSARRAGRTGMTFNAWREGEITQAGVAWLLACVFIRFLEDNDLLSEVFLSGPGDNRKAGEDRRRFWYRSHPSGNDREYILDVFAELEVLPGLRGLLDRAHNPVWSVGPDGDGVKAIWDLFQETDPDTGVLRHDFTDRAKNTRFLGDLYQNISESARKRYALLQTPDFIVDFILNRTLEPALKEFPIDNFRLIDPACGSGHFLLDAFDRLFRLWASREGDLVVVVQRTLDCVYGVDLNPYAAEIARFRLLIAALRSSGIAKLDCAPDWQIHVVTGDSLLFGPNKMMASMIALPTENPAQLRTVLQTQGYHVVIGNPPYINVQDADLRRLYRRYYESCSGKYQVSVPFTELLFNLAEPRGYIGMITSNAFMKRSFGKVLIEQCLPKWDMTHVIDTSGVFIPGHGTPTTILFGRNGSPVADALRVVRGIRGELTIPAQPSVAPVWAEISERLDQPGFTGLYVSVDDALRSSFQRHPWSIGGGGAAQLKERLDEAGERRFESIGSTAYQLVTAADEIFETPAPQFRRFLTSVGDGRKFADWEVTSIRQIVSPSEDSAALLWPWRTTLANRLWFGKTQRQRGLQWWAWGFLSVGVDRSAPKLAYGEIDTHPSFVYSRGGMLFDQTAPVVRLRESAAEESYLALLGILNSSTACFWLRQVCRNKGIRGEGGGLTSELWEQFFAFNGTNMSDLPLPACYPTELATTIQAIVDERSTLVPAAFVNRQTPTRASLDSARHLAHQLLLRMISLQEELDWHVYYLYGLLDTSLTLPVDQVPPVQLGERTFEILMARAVEVGDLDTEWFKRHRSTSRTKIPDDWPTPYRALVQRRIDVIANDRDIALIEQAEYKRRWNLAPWDELEQEALRNWLLRRLEEPRYWPTNPPRLTSVARLADAARVDSEFLQVAELYRGRPDFDLSDLVQELVARESVPFLPALRYSDNGMRIRADWERIWELQRREDSGENVEVPVPPKYERTDFLRDYWRRRGKLDVPKERWVSYPYLERDADKSPVIAWAGYDHGQQALALASYGYDMRSNEGWTADRLIPILAGLQQLQPWLDQWHNEIDPHTQQRLNESIRTFVESEMTQLGITAERIREWRPPTRVRAPKPRKPASRRRPASDVPTEQKS